MIRRHSRWSLLIPARSDRRISIVLWFILFGAIYAVAFSKDISYPPEVASALTTAGDNHHELEKVLSHYNKERDSLKFRAACYLIANMEGHSYATYKLCDTTGAEVPLNALCYSDYNILIAAFDSLEIQKGILDFKRKEIFDDLKSVKSDFLIKHIDYAFRAWQEKPWARQLSLDQFCRYILPYRGSNEPLELWRKYFWDKYRGLETRMKDSTDPIEAARLINDDLKSWFRFDPIYYYHPTDQGLSEMRKRRRGRCEDMTNLAIFAMRANGLAVTSDYTPFWADAGNNHAWNAIVTPSGKVIPFMGAESDPGDYHLANKLAKVYRKMYEKHPENLAFQKGKDEKIPSWLAGKDYLDVTADYTSVCDITVRLSEPVPDSIGVAYLCVFNSGEWQAIDWGRIKDNIATFKAVGADIAYLPAFYIDEKIVPAGPPFLLARDSGMAIFNPDKEQLIPLNLISTTKRELEVSTDGISHTFLAPGQEYELSYWDNSWQSIAKSVATDKPMVFSDVPSGCLYWLVATGSHREERIFSIENGHQIWW